jgi:hypothetical protein
LEEAGVLDTFNALASGSYLSISSVKLHLMGSATQVSTTESSHLGSRGPAWLLSAEEAERARQATAGLCWKREASYAPRGIEAGPVGGCAGTIDRASQAEAVGRVWLFFSHGDISPEYSGSPFTARD